MALLTTIDCRKPPQSSLVVKFVGKVLKVGYYGMPVHTYI